MLTIDWHFMKKPNQSTSIIGNIIPEFVENTQQYHKILQGIYKDIAHYDHAKTLQNPWPNLERLYQSLM
ncbi:MAG: hypothetical protein R3A45_03770 [Bdellovibrionota bacterium]